jgi:hypothetical protein
VAAHTPEEIVGDRARQGRGEPNGSGLEKAVGTAAVRVLMRQDDTALER